MFTGQHFENADLSRNAFGTTSCYVDNGKAQFSGDTPRPKQLSQKIDEGIFSWSIQRMQKYQQNRRDAALPSCVKWVVDIEHWPQSRGAAAGGPDWPVLMKNSRIALIGPNPDDWEIATKFEVGGNLGATPLKNLITVRISDQRKFITGAGHFLNCPSGWSRFSVPQKNTFRVYIHHYFFQLAVQP